MRLRKSKKRKIIGAVVFGIAVTLVALFIAVWIIFEWVDWVQVGLPDKPSAYNTGDTLIFPSREKWEEKAGALTPEMICGYGETTKDDVIEE